MTVVVISTGGTIASTSDNDGGASPELKGSDLVKAVPGLMDGPTVETQEFSNVPSPHLTVDQMASLAEAVSEHERNTDVTGVVVTIGTDILEEVAYFVDLCYDGEMPVVFTGAMRNASAPGADGPANLLASVRTVADEGARGRGVLVTFNDRVLPARDATKVHTTNVDTFRAPEIGPIGTVADGCVTWHRQVEGPKSTFSPSTESLTNDVYAVTITADVPGRQLAAAAESEALCFAATGAGHVPPTAVDELEALAEREVPLVATTRCPEGRLLRDTYSFRGSETTLRELGCYFSDRNLQKTRIETIVALASDGLDATFDRPGEA
jgi:L-asparaginase